jgi:hypothetical protein
MRGHRKKAVALFGKEQKEKGREVCDRLGVVLCLFLSCTLHV